MWKVNLQENIANDRRKAYIVSEVMPGGEREQLTYISVHFSGFFADLAKIESSGRIHQEWPNRHMPLSEQDHLANFIDRTKPEVTWPYLMLDGLRNVLRNGVTEFGLIRALAAAYGISPYQMDVPTYLDWDGEAFPQSYDLADLDRFAAEVSPLARPTSNIELIGV